jgi:hypothetical protein
MDPMSDVLAGMHVRSFGYGRLEAQSPWGLSHPKHSTSLGMVLQGTCWLTVDRIARSVELNMRRLLPHRARRSAYPARSPRLTDHRNR